MAKAAGPQAGKRVAIGGRTGTLDHGPAAPGQTQKFEIMANLFGEFGPAPRMVDVVNSQDVAIAKA